MYVDTGQALYIYTCTCTVHAGHSTLHLHTEVECRGFESHPRQLIFLTESDCLGCAVLLCLVVCLTLSLLASFFLPSHLSIKHVLLYMYQLISPLTIYSETTFNLCTTGTLQRLVFTSLCFSFNTCSCTSERGIRISFRP